MAIDIHADRAIRIDRACIAANNDLRDTLGDTLVRHFPEVTSGDERPESVIGLCNAIENSVRVWVEDNLPIPPTRDELVSALAIANSALVSVTTILPARPMYPDIADDVRAAADATGAMLERVGERNVPRP